MSSSARQSLPPLYYESDDSEVVSLRESIALDHFVNAIGRAPEPDESKKRHGRWAKEEERYRLHPRTQAEKGRHETLEWERHARLEDPCPCGSGKRYRRCCWQKIH